MKITELIESLELARIELGDDAKVESRNPAGDFADIERVELTKIKVGPNRGSFVVLLDA